MAILAEKYATDYKWYVDVILNLIRLAGDYVSEEVWYRVIQIVINREDVQGYAAKTVFEALQAPACHLFSVLQPQIRQSTFCCRLWSPSHFEYRDSCPFQVPCSSQRRTNCCSAGRSSSTWCCSRRKLCCARPTIGRPPMRCSGWD